jgi:hypothetical protein
MVVAALCLSILCIPAQEPTLELPAIAVHEAPPGPPPPLTMEYLASLSWEELENIYRQAPPGRIPCGYLCGRAVLCPGRCGYRLNQTLANNLWRGKHIASSAVVNQWCGFTAIHGKVYPGESWLDCKPAIILDYRPTSIVWRNVRDEMRQVAPGLYVGMMYRECCLCCCPRRHIHTYFVLQAVCGCCYPCD